MWGKLINLLPLINEVDDLHIFKNLKKFYIEFCELKIIKT